MSQQQPQLGTTVSKKASKKGKGPLAALRCANNERCSGYAVAPEAWLCAAGHRLCATCVHFYRARCPLAACAGAQLPRRSTMQEAAVSDLLLTPCMHRTKGCRYWFPKEELPVHAAECRYAPKACFSSRCDFQSDTAALTAHMQQAHKERVVLTTDTDFTIRNINTRTDGVVHFQYISCHLGEFWVKYLYSHTELQLYGAVQYIGPKQEAEKLEYQFEMEEFDDAGCTGLKAIYTGKLNTHVKTFETIFENEDCFTVSLDFAHYFENNGVLRLIVRVKEIETGFKD